MSKKFKLQRFALVLLATSLSFGAKAAFGPEDPEKMRLRDEKWQEVQREENERQHLAAEEGRTREVERLSEAQKRIAARWRGYRTRTRVLPMLQDQRVNHIALLMGEILRQKYQLNQERLSPKNIMMRYNQGKGVKRIEQLYAAAEKMADRYESAVKLAASLLFLNKQRSGGADFFGPNFMMPYEFDEVMAAAGDYSAPVGMQLRMVSEELAQQKWQVHHHIMNEMHQILDIIKADVRFKFDLITKREHTNLTRHPQPVKQEAQRLSPAIVKAVTAMAQDIIRSQSGAAIPVDISPNAMFRRYGDAFNHHDKMLFDEFWPIINEYVTSLSER